MYLSKIFSRHNIFILELKQNLIKMSVANMVELAKTRPVDFSLADALKSEIKFKIFTGKSSKETSLKEDDLQKFSFNKNLQTKVFIHGWNSNLQSNWYGAFKDEYFKKGDYNIIYVDWYIPGSKDYRVSTANVKPVGQYIGDFIIASQIDLKKVHLIGKSLGAHVSSHVGKRVQELSGGKKLGRITGLDPAAPKFEVDAMPEETRLNKIDAEFVDVIHTDAGFYGFQKPIGTVDFYPNGGGLQPGCKPDDDGHNESHGRSNWYFLESINSEDVTARQAKSWDDFLEGKFTTKEAVIFGENISTNAKGIYYFKTNATKPYTLNSGSHI